MAAEVATGVPLLKTPQTNNTEDGDWGKRNHCESRLWLALASKHCQAFSKSFHSNPSCFTAPRIVPNLRSFPPQSGRVAIQPLAGLCHTRWDPFPRLGMTSHPSNFSFSETLRYVIALSREIPTKGENRADFALKRLGWICQAVDKHRAAMPKHQVYFRGLPEQCHLLL
jgi:hypothetical protein